MKLLITLLILINPLLTFANVSSDEDDATLSKYEFGLSLAHINYPMYPGSDVSRNVTVPFPTFFYRGDVVRSDENGGIRGRIINSDRLEINLSMGGAPPGRTRNIEVRNGMPDLPFILEFGPGLIYKVIPASQDHKWSLSFNLPVRVPVAFNKTKLDDRGIVVNPLLFGYYSFIPKKFRTFFFASYRWGNKEFNETYYQVDPQFATSTRPAYQAKKGSVSSTIGLGLGYNFNNSWSATGIYLLEDLSHNANRSSPLFRTKHQKLLFLALSWSFFKSAEKQ
jgi:hypothetical protein